MTSEKLNHRLLDPKIVGRVLREQRHRVNLSQSDLAKRLGISKSYLCLLESGERTLTVRRFVAVAYELHTTPIKLLEQVLNGHPPRARRRAPRVSKAVREL